MQAPLKNCPAGPFQLCQCLLHGRQIIFMEIPVQTAVVLFRNAISNKAAQFFQYLFFGIVAFSTITGIFNDQKLTCFQIKFKHAAFHQSSRQPQALDLRVDLF